MEKKLYCAMSKYLSEIAFFHATAKDACELNGLGLSTPPQHWGKGIRDEMGLDGYIFLARDIAFSA